MVWAAAGKHCLSSCHSCPNSYDSDNSDWSLKNPFLWSPCFAQHLHFCSRSLMEQRVSLGIFKVTISEQGEMVNVQEMYKCDLASHEGFIASPAFTPHWVPPCYLTHGGSLVGEKFRTFYNSDWVASLELGDILETVFLVNISQCSL